jgi:sulfatase maturation enzyme AslB (radical SAM superfamily)
MSGLQHPGRPAGAGAAARWIGALVSRWYLRRPGVAALIAARYRSLRAVAGGVLNELAYRRGWLRAPVLLSANLELTNRCNLRCTFCPTGNGRMTRPRGLMDPGIFRRALAGARPLEYVLLFQWGEPLLHPQFAVLARRARVAGARTFLTTNGTLLDDRRVDLLLGAGLDRVTVSVDGDARTHERVRGVSRARVLEGLRRLRAARDARRAATGVDVSMVVAPETESAAATFGDDLAGVADAVQRIPLLTEGSRRTRCREPWRGGLVVLQDGRVTACCVDHDGDLAVGDVRDATLRELFNGARMRALRRAHVTGDLPPICARCTEYPTDAAAPRFSVPAETSRRIPSTPPRGASRRKRSLAS